MIQDEVRPEIRKGWSKVWRLPSFTPAARERKASRSWPQTSRIEFLVESAAIKKCIAAIIALVAIAGPLAGVVAQALSPTLVFEGNTTTLAKNGATQAAHIVVQSWGIAGKENEVPMRGFYVAHLLSGQILATIDGQTTGHEPGDYWAVKPGAAMRVNVVGEAAVLETIAVSKQ
jgi:hypothetical protein